MILVLFVKQSYEINNWEHLFLGKLRISPQKKKKEGKLCI